MRERVPKPFPWQALPRVDRRTSAVVDALGAWTGAHAARAEIATPAGAVRVRGGRVEVLAGPDLSRALGDPTSAVAVVRARGRLAPIAYVVGGGALVRGLARVILGGPDELDAPRAPTPAERGVLAYAVAAGLGGREAVAEPSDTAGPLLASSIGEAAVIELEVDGACTGWAALAVPLDVLATPRRRAPLVPGAAAWLDEPAIEARVVLGSARVPRDRGLAPRDVVVLARKAPDSAELRLARGGIAATLAPGGAGIIVTGVYARGSMDETLGEDASVEVDACAGSVTLSVRRVLELAPGQVVSFGRPLGGEIELRVGRQVVGRGELVDVDGELGVRVLSVEGGLARG